MQLWQNRIVGLEYHKPGDIAENPFQWRTHTEAQIAAIKGILAEVGIAGALLAYHSPGNDGALTAIDGHLRKSLEAGVAWPVLVLDVDDAEALKLMATFDPIGAIAQVDLVALQKVLEHVEMEDTALQAMLEGLAEDAGIDLGGEKPEDPGAQVDKAAELQEKWGTALGQVWEIGEHRLVCGDCTNPDVVASAMRGEKADAIVTDPPWGVGYDGGTKVRQKLANDDDPSIFFRFLPVMPFKADTPFYCWFAHGKSETTFAAFRKNGWNIRSVIIWNKNLAQFGALSAHYKEKKEPLIYAHRRRKSPKWRGPTNEVTVWDCARQAANKLHPTEKPVELHERILRNSTDKGDVVLDPFLGSGTTMVASHKLNRRCFGVEISPAYCAIVLERMSGMGLEARLME